MNVGHEKVREADIAIRSGRPSDPSLIATRLVDTPARLYATPGYLKKIGNPSTKADLSLAHFIGFWELVKNGLGIGAIIDQVGDAEPLVQRVLPSLAPIAVPSWLVTHREVHTSRRVRVVFDVLVDHLGPSRRPTITPSHAKRRASKNETRRLAAKTPNARRSR